MIALLFALVLAAPPGSFYTGAPAGKVADTPACSLTGSDDCEGEWVAVGSYTSTDMRVACSAICDVYLEFSVDGGATTASSVKVASDTTSAFHSLRAYGTHARLKITDTSAGANTVSGVMWLRTASPIAASRVDGTINRYGNTIAVRQVGTFDFDTSRGKLQGITTLHKFGRNPDVGATEEHVDTAGGTFNAWLTTPDEIRIRAGGDAADTAAGAGAREIVCQCLESFTATDYTDITIATAGASASALSSEQCVRVPRCYVSSSGTYHGSNTAAIDVENEAGTLLVEIPAARGQTGESAWTCPAESTCYVRESAACGEGAKGVDIYFWHMPAAGDVATPFVGSPRLIQQFPGLAGCVSYEHATWEAYVGPTDFWWTAATVSGSNTDVTVEYEIIIEADD